MELFNCDRYLGEEPCTSTSTSLNDFINRVETRKKRREECNLLSESQIHAITDVDISVAERKHGKSKKRSKESNKNEANLSSTLTECEMSVNTTRKRKSTIDLMKLKSKSKKTEKDQSLGDFSQEQKDVKIRPESSNVSVKNDKKKKCKKKKLKTTETIVDNNSNPVCDITKQVEPEIKYEILGDHHFQGKSKVKRILPRWLAEPTIVSSELSDSPDCMEIDQLSNLNPRLKMNLVENGIKTFFPVQTSVIPYQLSKLRKAHYIWSRDLCVSAPTGSGKTLAYVLPILQAKTGLTSYVLHALIIVPVQELALQVASVFKKYAKGTGINIGCATGGNFFENESKILVRKREDGSFISLVDILVATPGRLVEHIHNTPGFTLKHLKYIVIDEADRVIEQKSLNWLHLVERQFDPQRCGLVPFVTVHNLSILPRRPQKLLFSATLSQDPEKLLQLNLFQPKLITSYNKTDPSEKNSEEQRGHFLGKFSTPSNITEFFITCTLKKKPLVVHNFLSLGWRKVFCFTKSCLEASRLSKLLQNLNPVLQVKELTTLLNRTQRERILSEFNSGLIDLLVCSDRLARGMDVKGIDYVILYDPPKHVKGYIHRTGRTGRAGLPGTAITILTPIQANKFHQMLDAAGKSDLNQFTVSEEFFEKMSPAYSRALNTLKDNLEKEYRAALLQVKRDKRKKVNIKFKLKKKIPLST